MSKLKNLLESIENGSSHGEPPVIVRVLNDSSNRKIIVTVSNGELHPPIADRGLTSRILASVSDLKAKGGVAGLIDTLDEQGNSLRLVIEIVRPKFELVVFGAGHVGQAVALMGALTGYDVTVVDDREEFASRSRLPDPRIRTLVSDYASATQRLDLSPSAAIVIVTRGHQYDEICLKNVIGSNATYVGMIGSRRRVLSVFKKLAAEGFSEQELQQVHAPIGLRIGAVSPQEIAVSILAEIIDHLNNPDHRGETNVI